MSFGQHQQQTPSPTIARHCPQCKAYSVQNVQPNVDLSCPHCSAAWGRVASMEEILQVCPVCSNRQFYSTKDFNQLMGCFIMLIGICLVPWTYGLSLPVFAGIDWLLYRKVPLIAVCYRCGTEFRNFTHPSHLKPFMHHIGLKHDKYR